MQNATRQEATEAKGRTGGAGSAQLPVSSSRCVTLFSRRSAVAKYTASRACLTRLIVKLRGNSAECFWTRRSSSTKVHRRC